MKALRLSSIALCVIALLSSCTKDSLQTSTVSSSSEEIVAASSARGVNELQALGDNDNKPKDLTSITIALNPNPVNQGSSYTVTGNVVFPIAVTTGRVVIERAVDEDADGNVIGYTSVENADDWVAVKTENIAAATSNYTITNTATATEQPGLYGFRLHFTPAGGAGVKEDKSTEVNLEVKKACIVNTFTVTPEETTAIKNADGTYTFTVTFTLASPEDVNDIKFQGGATSGGQSKHQMVSYGNTVEVHDNNQNTVLKWEGDLKACTPQKVTFSYKKKFSCPATDAVVTGEWTAKVGEVLYGQPVWATYTCQ
jgi:hypothetical protein